MAFFMLKEPAMQRLCAEMCQCYNEIMVNFKKKKMSLSNANCHLWSHVETQGGEGCIKICQYLFCFCLKLQLMHLNVSEKFRQVEDETPPQIGTIKNPNSRLCDCVPGQLMDSLFCVKAAFTPNPMLRREHNVYFQSDPLWSNCEGLCRLVQHLKLSPAAPSLHNPGRFRSFWTSHCTEFSSSWPKIPCEQMANKRGSMELNGFIYCYFICLYWNKTNVIVYEYRGY